MGTDKELPNASTSGRVVVENAVEEGGRALGRRREQSPTMTSTEPRHDVKGEGPLFSAYLDFYREQLIAGVLSLSPEAQRTTLVPSGWTPIELLSHVLHMERRWFVWGFLGEEVDAPWGDWSEAVPNRSDDARWRVADDVDAEVLVVRLREIG